MIIILKKNINNHQRYYKLQLIKNLFNEYMVERIFGNTSYLSPTGKIANVFNNKDEAKKYLKVILNSKLKRGYKIFKTISNNNYIKETK